MVYGCCTVSSQVDAAQCSVPACSPAACSAQQTHLRAPSHRCTCGVGATRTSTSASWASSTSPPPTCPGCCWASPSCWGQAPRWTCSAWWQVSAVGAVLCVGVGGVQLRVGPAACALGCLGLGTGTQQVSPRHAVLPSTTATTHTTTHTHSTVRLVPPPRPRVLLPGGRVPSHLWPPPAQDTRHHQSPLSPR